ncbi:MAG: penicillin-binding protein 1A [Symplocastrum torsivum CPER-KK1]|uniref:Penicillin-binding protein 1A n=1 Tax=Symplocastrum torsivum CPER-KK1 TaxID=450513 RepID=A0A951PMP5_9CYAN|nr:penicillin-binding protein 1A [Symplocastrum torsivum CPER-KK1]
MVPKPEGTSHSDVQQDEKKLSKSKRLPLTRFLQGAAVPLNGMKRLSGTVIEQFTGPRQLHRRSWFWLGLGVGGSAIALGVGWQALEASVPDSTDNVLTYVREDTVTIKAADGAIIQQIGPATRETLKVQEIPERLIQAFIAIEDRRFENHHGVDFQGVLRAALSNLQAGNVVEGGSTITQQLARIVYFDQEQSIMRKLKEMRMAQKIEENLSKDQILERYLNLVYLGSGAYGVTDAAWVYFSKTVNQLTVPEIAMLAALPPAPSEFSPFINEKLAKQRRDIVLQRMQDVGYLTPAEAQAAIATPLTTKRSNPKRLDRKAYYFTEYVQQELPKYVPKDVLSKGLTVETTLNMEWQAAAEEAIKDTIEENGRWQGFKQAALVAIDPRNGQIKAMVGGKDFYDQQFNRVTQAQRQPGSTFKTFLYTTAVAAGISPNRGYLDAPYVVDGYEPKNYSEKFRGWISIRDALISSINVVAVKTLIDVGWEPTIEVAKKMGIESKLHSTYSLALGASEVNLLEMTSAYGTLAAKGVHTKPHGIRRILDQHGKVIYEENFKGERAIDEETAAIMTWMLRSVVTNGTGRAAQLGRPVAGKTGTTDDARDLWFIGYIPQLVGGVWLGNDDNKPTGGASTTAAATWRQFMKEVVEDMEVEAFPDRPDKIEGRKPTIEAKRIRFKRAITKKVPDSERSDRSERSSEGTSRRSRRSDRTTRSEETPVEPRRSRRRRRSETVSQPQPQQEQPVRRSRRRRTSDNQASSEPAPSQPVSRRSSRRSYDSSNNSAPRQSAPRESVRVRRQAAQSAPPAPRPAAAPPAPKFEPAPVAAPPAPPASRKAPSAPAPAAPEAPASAE